MSMLNKNIRLAELKFDVEIWDWSESSSLNYKWGVKDIVSYIRKEFLLDEGSVSIKPGNMLHFMNISYSRFGKINDGVTLNILRPSFMEWDTFSEILEKVDLTDSFKQYQSKLYKRAELKFEVEDTHSGQSIFLPLNQVIQQMKDLYAHMYKREDGIVDIHIFYDHVNERMKYTFSTDHINHKFFIYAPKNMSQEVFLTILKGSGIYAHNNVYDEKRIVKKRLLKKSSIQKLSELKFLVSVVGWDALNSKMLKRVKMSVGEIKKEIKRTFDFDEQFEVENPKNFFPPIPNLNSISIHNEHRERDAGLSFIIHRPEGMNDDLFLKILEGAGLLDERKIEALGRTISKRAELKFRVEVSYFVQRYSSPNFYSMKEKERHFLSIKELKDKLDSISQEVKRNKRHRNNNLGFHVSYPAYRSDPYAHLQFHEDDDVQEKEYRIYVSVLRPESLPSNVFKNLIKEAVKNVRL